MRKHSLALLIVSTTWRPAVKKWMHKNNKVGTFFSKHLKTFQGSVMDYMDVSSTNIQHSLSCHFLFSGIEIVPNAFVNVWSITSKRYQFSSGSWFCSTADIIFLQRSSLVTWPTKLVHKSLLWISFPYEDQYRTLIHTSVVGCLMIF